MEKETMEIVIKTLADKLSLLEWQLKNAEEEKAKLKAINTELEAINHDLGETVKHINRTYQGEGGNKNA